MRNIPRKKIKKVELFCDECRGEHDLGLLCRTYLRLQKYRVALGLTLLHIRPESEVYMLLKSHYDSIHASEKGLLENIVPILERQPLWEWCSVVSGFGHVAACTFHSFIRTHVHVPVCSKCGVDVRTVKLVCPKCGKKAMVSRRVDIDTAGKAKSYFGLVPEAKLKAGRKVGFNPQAKGRILGVSLLGIFMSRKGKGDSYYRPLFDAKKYFYANNSKYAPALNDPKLCPNYEPCYAAYLRKAKREHRKPKKLTCKGHINNMAKRWLGGILVSHATQLIREGKGLDVTNFKNHRVYIRPKAFEDDVPDPDVLEQIRIGKAREDWRATQSQ